MKSAFDFAPLPWRFDSTARNILAADGSIVARAGDSDDNTVLETIVRLANSVSDLLPNSPTANTPKI